MIGSPGCDRPASADEKEILAVSDELSRNQSYGAAQMICRLARERDEARAENERLQEALDELIIAAKRLSVAAQTSGGTAGRDEGLCDAIDYIATALSRAALQEPK